MGEQEEWLLKHRLAMTSETNQPYRIAAECKNSSSILNYCCSFYGSIQIDDGGGSSDIFTPPTALRVVKTPQLRDDNPPTPGQCICFCFLLLFNVYLHFADVYTPRHLYIPPNFKFLEIILSRGSFGMAGVGGLHQNNPGLFWSIIQYTPLFNCRL